MASYDFTSVRLFVEGPLAAGGEIETGRDQANYLLNVMRLAEGDAVLLFDGANGEWRARLRRDGRKAVRLVPEEQMRPQPPAGDLWLLFAPLKHARFDYLVQKAVEMGASRLQPVITQHTQVARVNTERMRANAIEAAEQCGVLAVAECHDPQPLAKALDGWSPGRLLVFCDEGAASANPVEVLAPFRGRSGGVAVLVGPEGGFSQDERAMLHKRADTVAISLGPRILRADTAGVAALAVVQATLGDWR
ncbi:MAG: 16S rRNA (uracil(1498)-N(3))-methyltransferase [Phreatobacter sp.]|uniref:16S rRNA (uracil(1498)-N(3))-methyltransferase n=1 Tax=Phreatobacter sp. TaxID=1966341 RepID=UPI001A6249B4|nr:16S rRNA (uracil(1498)-N(3))-methyltransferase [Phreatobacter sp.]MBL8569198.1 16S rRNA (uracil(1498)-N(3))-methyltransferase [Phreatobacter sp.]